MVLSQVAVIQFKVEFIGKGLKENIRLTNVDGIVSPNIKAHCIPSSVRLIFL